MKSPVYGQCMASDTGSCIETEITKLPVGLIKSPVYGQCTASDTGPYIDLEITKLPVGVGGTSM